MRMGRYSWIFVLLTLLGASQAHAAVYSWTAYHNRDWGQYSSAEAACQRLQSTTAAVAGSGNTTEYAYMQLSGEDRFDCYFQVRHYEYGKWTNVGEPTNNVGNKGAALAIRSGDSCPPGESYIRDQGKCVQPSNPPGDACVGSGSASSGFGFIFNASGECVDYVNADLPSQCKNLGGSTGKSNVYVHFDSDGNPEAPPPLSVQGCEAVPYGVAQCKMAPARKFPTGGEIQSSFNKCILDVRFTGATSGNGPLSVVKGGSGESGVCDPATECSPPPDEPVQSDEKPCVYVEDGEGRRVCSSNNYNYVPGESNCGTVQGNFVCLGKAPKTNGVKVETTVTEKNNPDGSKETTKKDTITQTTCVGANACTSTTTRNSTVVITDSAGNKTSQSGSCEGPLCTGGSATGDSNGDGVKDCIGPKCESNELTPVDGQDWFQAGDDTMGSVLEGFAARIGGSPIIHAGDQFFTFSASGTCPVWRADTWIFHIVIDQHCSTNIPWDVVKAIIIACASFVAFRWALL